MNNCVRKEVEDAQVNTTTNTLSLIIYSGMVTEVSVVHTKRIMQKPGRTGPPERLLQCLIPSSSTILIMWPWTIRLVS